MGLDNMETREGMIFARKINPFHAYSASRLCGHETVFGQSVLTAPSIGAEESAGRHGEVEAGDVVGL